MNQNEVVETLLAQAKIEPGFTELGNGLYHDLIFLCYESFGNGLYPIIFPWWHFQGN